LGPQKEKSQKYLKNNLLRCQHRVLKLINPGELIKHKLIQQQVLLVPRDLISQESINQMLKYLNQMHLKLLHLHHLGYLQDWVSLRHLLYHHKQLNQTSLSQQTQPSQHLSFRVYSLALVLEVQLQSLLSKKILTNQLTFSARLIL
jgi:hypothetical protein